MMALLCTTLFACSNGELEDIYPVAPDQKEGNSTTSGKDNSMEAVVKGIKENMIYIYGGNFTMGATEEQEGEASSDEYPAHQASLDAYRLCRYEMTQREWNAIATWGNYPKVDFTVKGDDLPVTDVTYDMCLDIIDILNRYSGLEFRLPTEKEWEYAARQYHLQTKYSGGDRLYSLGWYENNSDGKPHPVGEMAPNSNGFYDMSGNVAEFCSDYYTDDYKPGSPVYRNMRVARGGGYDSEATHCRVSTRIPVPNGETAYDLGLRLAIDKLYDVQLSSTYEEFGIEGGEREVKVTTDGELLRCHSDVSWCKVVKSGDKLIISVEENKGTWRETEISVLAGDEEWEGGTVVRIIQEGKKIIGTLYDQNGIRGVVYEVDGDGRNGKIVSLQETSAYWSTVYSDVYAYAYTNGEYNMSKIREQENLAVFPAFQWCYNYSYDYKWYLPAKDELADMFAAIRRFGASKFDQLLAQHGGDEISSASDYWSSTQYDSDRAYTVNKSGTERTASKTTNYRVRAIRKVTFD